MIFTSTSRGLPKTRTRPRDKGLWLGGGIVATSLFLAIVGPAIAPHDPESATRDILQAPSGSYPFGTGASGIDVFSYTLAAFRTDVLIAVVSVGIAVTVGVVLGALAGYAHEGPFGKGLRWVLLRATDLVQAIPVFILALALVGATGPSVKNVIIAIAFVNIPIFLRLTRAAVEARNKEAYVDAARVLGLPDRSILGRHILPNSLDTVIGNASITIGFAVLLTAALSFLGAGVRPPTPEWGATIASGSQHLITGQWWISVIPGFVLSIVVLGFAVFGDAVRRRRNGA